MALIPWVDVIRRKYGTDYEREVIQSYPFPDVIYNEFDPVIAEHSDIELDILRKWINRIEDKTTRESTMRRLEFIRDIWHSTDWLEISFKEWKYIK